MLHLERGLLFFSSFPQRHAQRDDVDGEVTRRLNQLGHGEPFPLKILAQYNSSTKKKRKAARKQKMKLGENGDDQYGRRLKNFGSSTKVVPRIRPECVGEEGGKKQRHGRCNNAQSPEHVRADPKAVFFAVMSWLDGNHLNEKGCEQDAGVSAQNFEQPSVRDPVTLAHNASKLLRHHDALGGVHLHLELSQSKRINQHPNTGREGSKGKRNDDIVDEQRDAC